jgi:hypothetical protein
MALITSKKVLEDMEILINSVRKSSNVNFFIARNKYFLVYI